MTSSTLGEIEAWATIARVIAEDAPQPIRDSLIRLATSIEAVAADVAREIGLQPRNPAQPLLPLEMAAC